MLKCFLFFQVFQLLNNFPLAVLGDLKEAPGEYMSSAVTIPGIIVGEN